MLTGKRFVAPTCTCSKPESVVHRYLSQAILLTPVTLPQSLHSLKVWLAKSVKYIYVIIV